MYLPQNVLRLPIFGKNLRDAPFRPVSISSLEKWSSPSGGESAVTTKGGNVSVLKDRSGNAYNGTGVNDPQHNETTKLITFVQASSQQIHFNSHVSNIAANTQGEIFIVIKPISGATEYVYTISDISSGSQFLAIFISFTEKVRFNISPGVGNVRELVEFTAVVGTSFILSLSSNGSAYHVEVNGTVQTFSGLDNGDWLGDLSGIDTWGIGALLRAPPIYGDIALGDDLYFSQQLTTQQRADMFDYLNDIYGVY